MRCPLCGRGIERQTLTHALVGDAEYLCGYTSRVFRIGEALGPSLPGSVMDRLWEALDHHVNTEGVEVEVSTDRGWTTVRALLLGR